MTLDVARTSWQGTVDDGSDAILAFNEDGKINYPRQRDDPADVEAIEQMRPKILRMQSYIKKANGNGGIKKAYGNGGI